MKNNTFIVSGIIIFLLIGAAIGPTIFSEPSSNQPTSNSIEVLKSDQTGITLSLSLAEFEIIETNIEGNEYHALSASGYGATNEIGLPAIPVLRKSLCIPDDASSISVSIKEANIHYETCLDIIPVQPPLLEESSPGEFIIDTSFYAQDENYPSTAVEISSQQPWRNLHIITLSINPIQFNPLTQLLTIYDTMIIEMHHIQ
jgi:hypothetical protein